MQTQSKIKLSLIISLLNLASINLKVRLEEPPLNKTIKVIAALGTAGAIGTAAWYNREDALALVNHLKASSLLKKEIFIPTFILITSTMTYIYGSTRSFKVKGKNLKPFKEMLNVFLEKIKAESIDLLEAKCQKIKQQAWSYAHGDSSEYTCRQDPEKIKLANAFCLEIEAKIKEHKENQEIIINKNINQFKEYIKKGVLSYLNSKEANDFYLILDQKYASYKKQLEEIEFEQLENYFKTMKTQDRFLPLQEIAHLPINIIAQKLEEKIQKLTTELKEEVGNRTKEKLKEIAAQAELTKKDLEKTKKKYENQITNQSSFIQNQINYLNTTLRQIERRINKANDNSKDF